MKVMLITGRYPPQQCGIGDYTYELAKWMSSLGHHVSVLSSALDTTAEEEIWKPNHVEAMREVSGWHFRNAQRILKLVEGKGVDVLHIQYQASSFDGHPMMTLLPLLVKCSGSGRKVKMVVTMHEFAGPAAALLPGAGRRFWLLPLMNFSDAVVVTNESDMSYMVKVPFLRRKLRLIPLGSSIQAQETSQIRQAIVRKQLGLDEEEILSVRFGFVHSVREQQLDILLHAVKRVCERGYRLKMVFVGGFDGEGRAEMMSLARSMGIEDRVLFTGFCSPAGVSEYLGSADIGVFPFPDGASERRTSLLAAMACGLPIVSTKKRLASFLSHRENILLVPPGDPVSLADAIEELIENKDLREELSANARRSSKQFCWERVGNATDELYRWLLS